MGVRKPAFTLIEEFSYPGMHASGPESRLGSGNHARIGLGVLGRVGLRQRPPYALGQQLPLAPRTMRNNHQTQSPVVR